jgi:NADP-dependent 3-hydroxy acid dehydrogenase YdfG
MTQGIDSKVVVITGASGLGQAAARQLTRDGAKGVVGARRIERLQALGRIDIHFIQMVAAARWVKARKCRARRS